MLKSQNTEENNCFFLSWKESSAFGCVWVSVWETCEFFSSRKPIWSGLAQHSSQTTTMFCASPTLCSKFPTSVQIGVFLRSCFSFQLRQRMGGGGIELFPRFSLKSSWMRAVQSGLSPPEIGREPLRNSEKAVVLLKSIWLSSISCSKNRASSFALQKHLLFSFALDAPVPNTFVQKQGDSFHCSKGWFQTGRTRTQRQKGWGEMMQLGKNETAWSEVLQLTFQMSIPFFRKLN